MSFIQALILVQILRLPIAEAIWICPPPDCETNLQDPPDLNKLRKSLRYDVLAERKFHFDCYTGTGDTEKYHTDPDLQECPHSPLLNGLPGVKDLQYGYNVVTDRSTRETSHVPILDITSKEWFNATVLQPATGKCYAVPDALVSQNIGVDFKSYSSRGFQAVGASSVKDYLDKSGKSRKLELSLEAGGYGMAASAAFSDAESTDMLKGFSSSESQDRSEMSYVETYLELHIATPIPTTQLIASWKDLASVNRLKGKSATEVAFDKYFSTIGTHYFMSASVGGKFSAVFSTKRSRKTTTDSSAEKRASCVSAKASGSYMGVSASAAAASCGAAYSGNSEESSAEDFANELRTLCLGGEGLKCPADLQSKSDFDAWRASIQSEPVLLLGYKAWIPDLVQYVIVQAQGNKGSDGNSYRDTVRAFGDSGSLSTDLKLFAEFKDLLHHKLQDYLKKHNYCKKNPDCDEMVTSTKRSNESKTIEGVVGFEVGRWQNWEKCPLGSVARSFRIFNDREGISAYSVDYYGVCKIELYCGDEGDKISEHSDKSKPITSGNLANRGNPSSMYDCSGYFGGFQIASQRTKVDGRHSGVTNIRFACVDFGSQNNTEYEEMGEEKFFPEPLLHEEYSNWILCPR